MNPNSERIDHVEPSVLLLILRKVAPGLLIGAAVGGGIAFLAHHNPSGLRWLSIVAAVIFACVSVLYFYWASCSNSEDSYQWSIPERAGILVSGLAALTVAAKLAIPDSLPGSTQTYFFTALILAFVVRPLLACIGARNHNSEQAVADQRAARRE